MAKKSLLGNIIGQGAKSPSDQGTTISDEASKKTEKGNEQPRKTNGGEEVPPVQIKEVTTKEPIVKEKASVQVTPIETPREDEKETLVLSHPVKKEPIQNKAGSGSIRISQEEITYLDDLVSHKKMSGHVNYTKKEALSEAIALLMDKYPKDKLLKPLQR